MSIERVSGTDLSYFLIAYDADGRERADDPDGIMSEQVVNALTNVAITDVFMFFHGWKGDVPAAREQYSAWVKCMTQCTDDIARMREAQPNFHPLLVGVHWPSQPWGEENFAVSFATPTEGMPGEGDPVEELIESYAQKIADTPTARVALRTIVHAAMENIAPSRLSPQVRDAYLVLDRESGLGSDGEVGAPGNDREPFDPERAYQASRENAPSFGGIDVLGGLLSPLRQLSFWKVKDRARRFGESAGHQLLCQLEQATDRPVRFHLMGHSFGCIVVSATLKGLGDGAPLLRPVDSVALVQGALSLWSYCSDIPSARGTPGYFSDIIAAEKVAGPIITTHSTFDSAVGRFYPIGAGVAGQVVYAPGELPKYGALGAFGAQGDGIDGVDVDMKRIGERYGFERGRIYNLESSKIIKNGEGASGAHSDITHPEVAHALWEAARVTLEAK